MGRPNFTEEKSRFYIIDRTDFNKEENKTVHIILWKDVIRELGQLLLTSVSFNTNGTPQTIREAKHAIYLYARKHRDRTFSLAQEIPVITDWELPSKFDLVTQGCNCVGRHYTGCPFYSDRLPPLLPGQTSTYDRVVEENRIKRLEEQSAPRSPRPKLLEQTNLRTVVEDDGDDEEIDRSLGMGPFDAEDE